MLSRLANVLQELSGEEAPDADPEAMLVPQPPAGGESPAESEVPEDIVERLAHLEQLVVQLKELVRDKDTQLVQKDTALAGKDAQLKNEKEEADARFNKLKLQAKAKMASLTKQISDLKGQGGASSPESSFTSSAAEPELQELRSRLGEEEAASNELRQRLQATEQLLQEKEAAHAEQVKVLQAVVCEKDGRFQEQIQKHEEELQRVGASVQGDVDLQQALQAAGRRCEELEEALNSRSQLLEMLQQEVSSADQQKQILTAQFRQMEQELAESLRLREEDKQKWAEQTSVTEAQLAALHASLETERSEAARQNDELCASREAEQAGLDALEKERAKVARLESEFLQMKEAELAAVQVSSDASEEVAKLRSELERLREAESAAAVVETSEVLKLELELTNLREEHDGVQKQRAALADIWRHLCSLSPDTEARSEDAPVPEDPLVLWDTVHSVETQLNRLKHDCSESEQRHVQILHQVETLQDELLRRSSEQEEAEATIQHLQQQVATLSNRRDETEELRESQEAEKALVFTLQQQLLEKDGELAAVRESLRLATAHVSDDLERRDARDQEQSAAQPDTSVEDPDLTEEAREEEETTLVAEDTSVISISAGNESSPELIGHQSDSPGESKGTSSDEMVASSDSEVAQSSWTLLEAVNQDSSPEWPSVLQDFNQSWVATSVEQETSTVQVESSSVVIRETVQVHVTQRDASTPERAESSSEAFAQALAEELQRSNGNLLTELQRLKERIKSLEEEAAQSLAAAREEAETQASKLSEELKRVQEELENYSQQSVSLVQKHHHEVQLLEEQLDILNTGNTEKEQKIQALQTDLEAARQALCEQEGQARMLSAQLEDRELQLQELDNSMLQYSQMSDLNNESLTQKDSEISELQRRLSQKEQEMTELNVSMSAKLLQAVDEKLQSESVVGQLKEQIVELQKVGESQQQMARDDSASQSHGDDEHRLEKEKEVLETQLVNAKKKLQVALVQRKELMKKVNELEGEVKKWKEKEGESVEGRQHEVQEMETRLQELEEVLKTKEEMIENLVQKVREKDDILMETLALNERLSDEAAKSDASSETTALQSQVSSLEAECESLQKKLLETQESRKETIRKAKEKDRHHREQLKLQKEEYNELMERFESQSGDHKLLLEKLKEQEEKDVYERQEPPTESPVTDVPDKSTPSVWVQEDWVDFAASESDSSRAQSSISQQCTTEHGEGSKQMEEDLKCLQDELQAVRTENAELVRSLQETQTSLLAKETEISEFSRELQELKEKEKQIDALSEELMDLREKHLQAERRAEALKADMEIETTAATAESTSTISSLQAEVEEFKQFLDNKNQEILDLSEQLSEQGKLIHSMQDVVSQKDQLIFSLQEEVRAEQEKSQRVEVESPTKQDDDAESKAQQLQRKLQAALISRKETLRENKAQKEKLASIEKTVAELQLKIDSAEVELEKLREEKVQLSKEVQQTLLDNQNLGSSCESLKLAMEGIISEKDACQRELKLAKDEASRAFRETEERVEGMKEEYETLLRSYENVSDEAERVRKVLEAARQERQELAAKMRSQEAARQEAERQAEEAQKEVGAMKDKMRKFAKTKQQKISELEEENEKLRELQEKRDGDGENEAFTAEIQQLQEELEALKEQLEATVTERDSLGLQIDELKEQLSQAREQTVDVPPSDVVPTLTESLQSHSEREEKPSEVLEELIVAVSAPEARSHPAEDIPESSSVVSSLEDKMKEMEREFNAERELWQQREAELELKLASIEQDSQVDKEKESQVTSLERFLQESREREKSLAEEATKRETQVKDLLKSLEAEKDNLEERLMNQLAQLNGSIASYQQEAADNRNHLNELQRAVERLERERAELEAEACSERERASRLEEDMRQAQRERTEAEAQSGKQRELEQQLRSAQRVKEGSQGRAKQLEELLREKQLEVRQLQKDCIQYQERISELGKEAKALQHSHYEVTNKLERSQADNSETVEELKKVEAELLSFKSKLEEAQIEANKATAAKTALEQSMQQREDTLKAEAEQTLDSVRFRLGAELKEVELRLEESYSDRDKEEEATLEARELAADAERRAQEVQARLDESLARLAAFSRCMSSLQDDRDRVVDEARQWESRFNGALQAKEAEIQEAETRVKDLTEKLKRESSLKEELQASVKRLEKADADWQLKLKEKEKDLAETKAALEEEMRKLHQTTVELQSAQSEAHSLQTELDGLRQRARALEEAVAKLQDEAEQARAELSGREAEERRLCLSVEQLETDLRASKALTETLQSELHEKEQREVEMLGEKELAVTQAAEEARKEADGRAREAEEQLEQRRGEVRDLGDQLRKAEEESSSSRAKLDSFMKAMGSLQDDRDRVLNMYKQLEEKHLQVMMEKDGLIQEAATENNGLKEELRSLLVQRDDLYAEKAKLSAQIHGYREELNQVLSLKESQHRAQLNAQRERLSALERERGELQKQLRSVSEASKDERSVERETLTQASQPVDAPGAEVEKLREQLQAAKERADDLEGTLLKERESKDKELAELRWEDGVMRTESESAQERVSELAHDLLAVEQKLLQEREVSKQLRAEKSSFSKAMASLQDSRDQAVRKVQELSLRLEEMNRMGVQAAASSPGGSTGEVWGLKNALQALQNDRERLLEQLQTQTSELQRQKAELARLGAGELIRVSQELLDEREKKEEALGAVTQLQHVVETGKQEIETLRLERMDWTAQAEQLKQQTLITLAERDQQLRELSSMLQEAQAKPRLQQESYQREGQEDVRSAPGAPQERSSLQDGHAHLTELKDLQRRLDEEMQQRAATEEQLTALQDRLLRHPSTWHSAHDGDHSETSVFIEPSEGAVTRQTRRSGPGLVRMLRVTFCSRQRTPLLFSLYVLVVHVLLLLCLSGHL